MGEAGLSPAHLSALLFSIADVEEKPFEPGPDVYAPATVNDFAWFLWIAGPSELFAVQAPNQESQEIKFVAGELKEQEQPVRKRCRRFAFDISWLCRVYHDCGRHMDSNFTPAQGGDANA